MRFIRAVRVVDFRSLAEAELVDVGDIAPVVGANGTGKSNLFRSLNLFFNDRIEGDEPLDLRRDFREPGRRRKLKVVVEVDLSFGTGVRPELKDALKEVAGASSDVTIRKEYTLDPVTKLVNVDISVAETGKDLAPVADARRGLVQRLLSVVRFRYVPNHLHPSELLRQEEQNIRRMLFARLGKGRALGDEQIQQIQQKATDLMQPVQDAMSKATGEVQTVELGTPEGWKDLVWAFGLKMQASQSSPYEALLHGSGIQSLLAYNVLALIDTSLGGELGWRRGAIWALEEPESFLHASLQAELAANLARYSEGERLQILFTTHSPAFLGVAHDGFAVSMSDAGRSEIAKGDRADLFRASQQAGVTSFAHPLHAGPPKPLLLVEGKSDRELLTRAYLAAPGPSPYEILALEDLEPALSGGVDQIRSYLHHNRSALRARPAASPVVVLIDWEEPQKKITEITKVLAEHPTSTCVQMPQASRNQDLSREFVGVEGFLSTAFYEAAAGKIALPLVAPVSLTATVKYGINRGELSKQKSAIHDLLRDRDDPADIQPLTDLVPWLNQHLSAGAQLVMGL